MGEQENGVAEPTRAVQAWRLTEEGAVEEEVRVVSEEPLSLDVEGVGVYTLMCTPGEERALAVGFLFTEGMIEGLSDLATLEHCEQDRQVLRVRLSRPRGSQEVGRNLTVASSCGRCGSLRTLEELWAGIPAVGDTLVVSFGQLQEAVREMRARQPIFAETGGTHAAGILNAAGEWLALAEDLGRHNALDKAIGRCLLSGQQTAGGWAVLSGRVSLELVSKGARAGLELLAAVSAPSSLAVGAARGWNMTICGFVRGDRATVYAHKGRIREE